MADQHSEPLSVSEFLGRMNELLETQVAWVEGEVSDVRISQEKFLHFDLKDENSLVHCFGILYRVRTPLEEGMKVRVWGVPRVYPRYGKFSLVVEIVEPQGEGALRRAFELLRAKLEQEGLFEVSRKRSLPRFPERIVLITSPDAAAYSDFLKVLRARRGGLDILVLPVPVQGKGAADGIARAIDWVNEEEPQRDALVLVRGGGGLEDLRAFNDELVVRALARSRVLTVVGVGHERDVTLADLVADVRASTPSNAAELLTPTAGETRRAVLDLADRLTRAVCEKLRANEQDVARQAMKLQETVRGVIERVSFLARRMEGMGALIRERARTTQASLGRAESLLETQIFHLLGAHDQRLRGLQRLLEGLEPDRVLARGYSITVGARGEVLKDARRVRPGDPLTTRLSRGTLHSVTKTLHAKGTPEFHAGVRGAGADRRRI